LTILKAALNYAWRDGYVATDEEWRKVKPFRGVDAPKIRYLELAECQRLINACEPDFRKLVRAALLTGCRYGELVRLAANDFNSTQGTVYIGEAKNGKPRYVPLTEEGISFFEEQTAGRLGNEHIFLRSDGEAWGVSHQSRRLKDACKIAEIEPAISFHVLRHTYGSLLASKGVPLQVIAELLGHSDTRVTSRHYAHLMPSFVSDTLRANLPNFVENEKQKVHKFAVKKLAISES
jgi:integrase